MPYYPPVTSSSGTGFNLYAVDAASTVDIPVNNENVCTNTFTADGILQITGKATVL